MKPAYKLVAPARWRSHPMIDPTTANHKSSRLEKMNNGLDQFAVGEASKGARNIVQI